MTVAELMEQLAQLPPDATVTIPDEVSVTTEAASAALQADGTVLIDVC